MLNLSLKHKILVSFYQVEKEWIWRTEKKAEGRKTRKTIARSKENNLPVIFEVIKTMLPSPRFVTECCKSTCMGTPLSSCSSCIYEQFDLLCAVVVLIILIYLLFFDKVHTLDITD